jgi:16S rRNA (adenine1518-N6/adenine1519-N6)-dimethyltransferase
MIQREVAERISAKPGTSDYAMLSVIVQGKVTIEGLFEVPPESFYPVPKVVSKVIRLTKRVHPLWPKDEKVFIRFLKAAFCQKRKTINNSLSAGLQLSREETSSVLNKMQTDPTRRAETFSLEEFVRLFEAFKDAGYIK